MNPQIIRKILFTTDLSDHSRYAFSYAAAIAGQFGASIVFLHVMEKLPQDAETLLTNFIGTDTMEELKQTNENTARTTLIGKKSDNKMIRQALVAFSQKEAPCGSRNSDDEVIVTSGDVVETIISQAKTHQCDMIVMAYRPRNMLAQAMSGSRTRRVLRRSGLPVLLVPMPADLQPQDA